MVESISIGDILKAIMGMLMGAVVWIFKSSQKVQDRRLRDMEEQCKEIAPFRVIERVARNTEDIAQIKTTVPPIQEDITRILTILEERDKQWQRESEK